MSEMIIDNPKNRNETTAKVIDLDVMRRRITYDPQTGIAIYKNRPESDFATKNAFSVWNSRFGGKQVYSKRKSKSGRFYLRIAVRTDHFPLHRVVWTMENGAIPQGMFVDHINGDTLDNRLVNLRLVTKAGNAQNSSMQKNKKSGLPVGVSKFWKKYHATMYNGGKTTFIGSFNTVEEAMAARKEAEAIAGFHPNHGRIAHETEQSKA